MNFKDKWRFVQQNLKKNRVRIFMTVLATAMGTTFLIVLASVGFGLHDTLLKDIMEQDNLNEVSIYGYENEKGEHQYITDQHIEHFESLNNVKTVRRMNYLGQAPNYQVDNFEATAETRSVYFPAEQQAGMALAEGTFPTQANQVVVGYHFADELIPQDVDYDDLYTDDEVRKEETLFSENIIGKTLTFDIEKFDENDDVETTTFEVEVVGIVEEPVQRGWDDSNVYITDMLLNEIAAFTGTHTGSPYPVDDIEDTPTEKSYDNVYLHTHTLEQVQDLTTQLTDEGYYTYSVATEMKQLNMLFTIAKAGLIFIGTIAILIASIGIYNTMTMAVTERAPDIGIMKAIGANPRTIKQIFLLESSYIGLLGALIGTAVAYLISFAVNLGLPLILEAVFEEELPEGFQFSSIPLRLLFVAVAICLIVTIISGSRPAKKATQIDVLQAMKREI
ncbi:ABC transporter permease [Amphibacillus cookii]|uniref:ABC transporter permease n=1 Tax=Amphibacillus cookii TaxID=767787 RepID=UPI001959CFB5|nr:ABC transporter permease [Amphibacillus cookii]MBM7542917.1 acetoin utilization transport system permease protein [Amphibacillus cookii]